MPALSRIPHMRLIAVGRQVKHLGFVMRKRARRLFRAVQEDALFSRRRPFRFDPWRYDATFLHTPRRLPDRAVATPRRVFALWTGTNPLTPNRARNLEKMKATLGVDLVLITPDNLHEWVVDGHPLHPSYENLALIHRSDYLRCYLMHHHGGGYCDIKQPLHTWEGVFDRFDRSPGLWWAGVSDLAPWSVAQVEGRLGEDLRRHYAKLTVTSCMIARPSTPLTAELLSEVERRLDALAPALAETPGGVFDEVPGYTEIVKWTSLLGDVLHPLQQKYRRHVVHDRRLEVSLTNYR